MYYVTSSLHTLIKTKLKYFNKLTNNNIYCYNVKKIEVIILFESKKKELLIGRSSLEERYQKIYDKIYKAVMNMDNSVKITIPKDENGKRMDASHVAGIIHSILYPMLNADHPEIFWFNPSQCKILQFTLNIHSICITLSYNTVKELRDAELAKMSARIDEVVNLYKDQSDFDFALSVMEWLDTHTYYDYSLISDDKNDMATRSLYLKYNTAYGPLVKGASICFGYASAYNLILKRRGIPCLTVIAASKIPGEAGHAWNMAMIDGEWCHIDCTYADYNGRYGKDNNVETDYAYFGLNDELVLHLYQTDLVYAKHLPRCTSKKNNYFVRKNLSFSECNAERIVGTLFKLILSDIKNTGRKTYQFFFDNPIYSVAMNLAAQSVSSESYFTYCKKIKALRTQYIERTGTNIPDIEFSIVVKNPALPVLSFVVELINEEKKQLPKKPSSAPLEKTTFTPPTQTTTAPAAKTPSTSPAKTSFVSTPTATPTHSTGTKYSERLIPQGAKEHAKQSEMFDPLIKVVALVEIPSKHPFPIDGDSFTVGAGSKCDLSVYTTGVEECFRIYRDNGSWKIENKSPKNNHVYLYDKELTSVLPLRDNAIIRVSDSKAYRFTTDLDNWYKQYDPFIEQKEKKPVVTRMTIDDLASYLYAIPGQEETTIKALGSYIGESTDCSVIVQQSGIAKIAMIYYDKNNFVWKIKNTCGLPNAICINGEELTTDKELQEYDLIKIVGSKKAYRFIINKEDYLKRL